MALIIDLSGQANGTFTIEDDGIAGNNTSIVRRPDGTILATFVHPADEIVVVSRAGQSVNVNFVDSLTAAGLTIGSLTVPASSPDSISIGSVVTSGIVTLAARNAINELGNDVGTDVIAGRLFMDAGAGIGAFNPIETQVSVLEAESVNGGINLTNLGNVTIGGAALGTANLRGLFTGTSGNITLINQGSITLSDDDGLESVHSAGSLTLSAIGATSDISSDVDQDALSALGNMFLNAGRDVNFGTVVANADNDVRAGANIFVNAGRDFHIDGFADMAANDQGLGTNGGITITAGRDILVDDANGDDAGLGVTNGTGSVVLTTGVGGSLVLHANSSLAIFAGAGGVTARADRMLIEADSGISVNAGGVVTLTTASAGHAITLGVGSDGITAMELSDAELDRIFAANVVIGGDTAGTFNVSGAITHPNSNLTLRTGGDLIISSNITTPTSLTLHGGESITQIGSSTITTGTFQANVDSPDNDFAGGQLTIAGNLVVTSQSLRGNDDADRINGNAIGNILFGFAGNDTLDGGVGNDIMNGGLGNDTFVVDSAGDLVAEAANEGINDRVFTFVTYTLPGAAEIELLTAQNQALTTPLDLTGNGFNQIIIGNAGVNSLQGLGGNDTLFGNGDNDTLNGGIGDDVTVGGTGNDIHIVDGIDAVLENVGEGSDQVITTVSYNLGLSAEVELIRTIDPAATTAINIVGNGFGQQINGNAGPNTLSGVGGADSLFGFGGNDGLNGGAGDDTTTGGLGDDLHVVDSAGDIVVELAGEGNDRVLSSADYTLADGVSVEILATLNQAGTQVITLVGNDLSNNVQGNEGSNTLLGGGDVDALFGVGGIDVLNGGAGNDVLNGGAGADSYVFDSALAVGHVDLIVGYAPGSDNIRLDNAIFSALAVGALPAGAFRNGTAAVDADDRIIYNQAAGAVFYDPDGVGGVAQIQFAAIQGTPVLTASDFEVI